MEWKTLKHNYHVKYEDYLLYDGKKERLVINTDKYKLRKIKFYDEQIIEDEVVFNNFYHPAYCQTKVEIWLVKKSSKEQEQEIDFYIQKFNQIGDNELISLKYKSKKIDKIINGVIKKDYKDYITTTKKPYHKLELFINYYKGEKNYFMEEKKNG